jgi:hypothetical protein
MRGFWFGCRRGGLQTKRVIGSHAAHVDKARGIQVLRGLVHGGEDFVADGVLGSHNKTISQPLLGIRQGNIKRTGRLTTRGRSSVSWTEVMRSPSRLELTNERT